MNKQLFSLHYCDVCEEETSHVSRDGDDYMCLVCEEIIKMADLCILENSPKICGI